MARLQGNQIVGLYRAVFGVAAVERLQHQVQLQHPLALDAAREFRGGFGKVKGIVHFGPFSGAQAAAHRQAQRGADIDIAVEIAVFFRQMEQVLRGLIHGANVAFGV